MNKNKTSIHLHTCIRLDWLVDEADTAETSIHLHTCIRQTSNIFYWAWRLLQSTYTHV